MASKQPWEKMGKAGYWEGIPKETPWDPNPVDGWKKLFFFCGLKG